MLCFIYGVINRVIIILTLAGVNNTSFDKQVETLVGCFQGKSFISFLYSYEIMLDCWSENPADRPTFTQLRDKFDAIILAENNDMYIQFSSIDTDTPSGYDHLAPVSKEVKHANVESKSSVALGYDRLAPVMNEANHAEGGSEISSTTFGDHRTSGYYVGEPLDSATYDNEPFRVHLGSNPNPYVKTPQSNSRFNLEEVAAEADGEILRG